MKPADVVESFLTRLGGNRRWPLEREQPVRSRIATYSAIRESDRDHLVGAMPGWRAGRPLIVDPLGEKIANAFADLLFGEDPTFIAAAEGDQGRLDALVQGSALVGEAELPAELWDAERLCVSEGEVWWRICRDYDIGHPLIEWHSRLDALPMFIGKILVGVAFVSELEPLSEQERTVVWRHFELNTLGRVDNFLFKGTSSSVGDELDLKTHFETELLDEVWSHGLPGMLAGRIPNLVGRNRRVGQSQYHGIRDLLFSLNEAATIGHENARLTLKRRVVVSPAALRQRAGSGEGEDGYGDDLSNVVNPSPPQFDGSEEVLVASDLEAELGGKDPYRVLEYSFDAAALIAWQSHLAKVCLTRADVAPALVGYDEGTGTESGRARRMRLLNSVNAAEGKARPWDAQVPQILSLCAMVEQLPVDQGGFGRPWTSAAEPQTMERTDPLPEDEGETVDRVSVAVGSKAVMSQKTGISELHPEWSEDQIDEELEAVRDDGVSSAPPIPTLPEVPAASGDGTGAEGNGSAPVGLAPEDGQTG